MTFAVTTVCTSLIALLAIVLAYRVSLVRRKHKVGVGDGGEQRVMLRIRAHANLVEFAPIALLLLLFLEQLTQARWLVVLMGLMLVVGRVMHAWGMSRSDGPSFGRYWGSLLTWVMMVITALLNLYFVIVWWVLAN